MDLSNGLSADDGWSPAVIPVHPVRGAVAHLLPLTLVLLSTAAFLIVLVSGDTASLLATAAVLIGVLAAVVHRSVSARSEVSVGARLRRGEAYFRSLVRAHTDAVLMLDDEHRVLWAAPVLLEMLGASAEDSTGRPLAELVEPGDVPALDGWLEAVGGGMPTAAAALHTLRLPRPDGGWHHLEATATDLRDDPEVHAVVLYCRDVTERIEREQRLSTLAYCDATTGLPNRASLLDRLATAIVGLPVDQPAVDDDAPQGAALLLFEVSGLAEARESLGRAALDIAVAEVGSRLRGTVRGDDVVARFSADVFAVLAHGSDEEADLVAGRCLSVIDQPITTELGLLDLTASVGVAVLVPADEGAGPGDAVTDLVEHAELALADAWAAGPGIVRRSSAALRAAQARRERLRRDLVGARARGELSLVFQPIVSLGEQRIAGAEALVRWTHPELGAIPPAEFLPIADRAGLIADIERWVLREAACAAVLLPEHGQQLRMGVNISTAHVTAGTLVGHVSAALAASGLAADRLVVEVHASATGADPELLRSEFSALRLMGVKVGLDGFDVETSTLAQLTQLSVDVVKLDRTFLTRVDRDKSTRALCEAVVHIGRTVTFDVVADGVESPSELAVLSRLGCGFAQGYLLSRPLSAAALGALLDERAGQLWPGLVGAPAELSAGVGQPDSGQSTAGGS